jgi:hypothetical protein
MGEVVELDDMRPHRVGKAQCAFCFSEWIAVAPVEVVALQCPKCHTMKGEWRKDQGDYDAG